MIGDRGRKQAVATYQFEGCAKRVDQPIDVVGGVVHVERGPSGGRNAEAPHERLAAVLASDPTGAGMLIYRFGPHAA